MDVTELQHQKDALLFFASDFGNWYQVMSKIC